MLPIKDSFGKFKNLASLQGKLIEKNSMENSINDLIDLIKHRIQEKPIAVVASGLKEHLFDLKTSLAEWETQGKLDGIELETDFDLYSRLNSRSITYERLHMASSKVVDWVKSMENEMKDSHIGSQAS